MSKNVVKRGPLALRLTEESLARFATESIIRYGNATIESRAVPDYRDGLKPVQRRLLWAMYEAGFSSKTKYHKSARTTGECSGKYHPHGSAYGSLVTIANKPYPLIATQGSFGHLNSEPAAERYTECKLNGFSEALFLNSSYIAVSNLMDNYDGEFKEPLVLPALLPHILLNGSEGIAVGIITGIPPFQLKGVVDIVKQGLVREITVKDCSKHLRIEYPYPFNSKILTPDSELTEFYKTGIGRLTLGSEYTINGLTMMVTSFPPHFDPIKAINKLNAIEALSSAEDLSDKHGNKLLIKLKTSIAVADREKVFAECANKLTEGFNLRINLIERIDDENVKVKIGWTMPQLINNWIIWRKDLEVRKLLYVAEQLAKSIANLELCVLACLNLDKIIPIIKSNKPDVEERLAQALGICLEDAKYILGITLRRLTGLSLEELQAQIAQKTALRKEAIKYSKSPADKILLDLAGLLKDLLPAK